MGYATPARWISNPLQKVPRQPRSNIGVLQVIFALPASNGGDYSMRIYNSDGSEPEMCGNGIRCLAKFVADIDGTQAAQHRVDTLGGQQAAVSAICRHTSCPHWAECG